jgi:biopolymer transport protein ExbB/TolQ
MNVMNLLADSGFVMIPLFIFSVIMWTIAFERIWYLRKFKSAYSNLDLKAQELLGKNNRLSELKEFCLSAPEFLNAPYKVLLDSQENKFPDLEERVERRLQEVHLNLKKYLWVLASIASTAPFVGLFGTVVGIIRSFEDISKSGKGGFSVVAAGLSEALIATAAGIIVAVIAVLFFNFLLNWVNSLSSDFRNRFTDFAAYFKKD